MRLKLEKMDKMERMQVTLRCVVADCNPSVCGRPSHVKVVAWRLVPVQVMLSLQLCCIWTPQHRSRSD